MPLRYENGPDTNVADRLPLEKFESYFVRSRNLTCGTIRRRYWQPNEGHYHWAINVDNGPCHYQGTAETLEQAKQLVEQSWRGWCAWAGLKDADE